MTTPPRERLAFILRMYRRGFFPMADERGGPLNWYFPKFRAILPLDERFHVPRRLRKTVRNTPLRITADRALLEVIDGCADRDSTWINEEYREFFAEFHGMGVAHSMEAWRGDRLVGGLYGLTLGSVFAGESMFSTERDASKVCLVHLVHRLRTRAFDFIDSQVLNDHTAQFGAFEVPQEEYLLRLDRALQRPRRFEGDVGQLEI